MRRGQAGVPWAAGCILLAFTLVGCEPPNAFVAPPPPEVTVALPVTAPVAETVDFTGTLEARQSVQLRARITGYLQRIAYDDGAYVQEGDLLYVIEPAPFEADVEAAEAALQKAQALEQLAKANLERALELQKDRAIAEQEVDANSAELATAKANVKSAQAALKKAQLDLNYTEIRAPIGGRIGRHLVDVGNLVTKEQTPLAVIENIDPIYAYFTVSESIILRFMSLVRQEKLPDPAVKPPTLQLALQNENGFPHQGYLDFTDLGVDPTTGTIRRRAIFPNANRELLPGLFVRLRGEIGDPTPKLLVEERAIGTDQRGDYLLVVNDKNVVEYRPVALGLQAGDLRVIESGIEPIDWVVINGLQRARPSSTVAPQKSEMASVAGVPKTDTRQAPAASPAESGEAPPASVSAAATPEPPAGPAETTSQASADPSAPGAAASGAVPASTPAASSPSPSPSPEEQ